MASVNTYLPLVRSAAKQYGVPANLLAGVLKQESGFNPQARSPAGALGIAQFMPSTARGFGIDPLNPGQAIPAAAKYLSNLHNQFGRWDYALAGYNAGGGAVQKYGGVPPYPETQNYVRSVFSLSNQFPGLAASGAGGMLSAPPGRGSGSPSASPPTGGAGASTPGIPADVRTSLVQGLLDQNARLANIPALRLPPIDFPQPATTPATTTTMNPGSAASTLPPNGNGYPLAKHGQIIGTPYQGTHKPGATTPPSWESDNAIDIAAKPGTPVYALADGVIGATKNQAGRYTAGWTIHLDFGKNAAFYGHLSRVAVRPGQRVRRGDLIGYSGSANGVGHLHLAVAQGDPRSFIGAR